MRDGPPVIESREPARWVRALLVSVVLLPIGVAVVRALRHNWFPIGDSALLYLRARDVLTTHHPLLGSWTSASLSVGENMNNPGPMYADLLAPVARVLPFSSAAALGVGLVNAAAVVGVSLASRKIGGWAMQRWMLLACALLAWVMGSELLIDIWQAHALLLPFLFFLVLGVGIALGNGWCVPWAAAIASLLVQTHVSYVYVVAVVLAVAVAVAGVCRRIEWSQWRRILRAPATVATAVVVLVLWAQPVWEQLFGTGKGNLARLVTNASGGDVRVGFGQSVRLVSRVMIQPPWRLRSGFSSLIPSTGVVDTPSGPTFAFAGIPGVAPALITVLAGLALLLVLGWACTRRQLEVPAAACRMGAGGLAGAPLCLAFVTVGEVGFAQHHVRWMWAFAVFVWIVAAWAAFELAVARWPSPATATTQVVVPVALTVVVAVAAVPYFAQQQGPVANYAAMPALRRIFDQLAPLEASDPVVYDISNLRVYEPYSAAVMMRMQELGIEFRVVDDAMVRQLGDARRADGTEPTTIFQLEGVGALDYRGPACRVAMASALSPDQETRLRADHDAVVSALVDGEVQVAPAALGLLGADRFAAARGGDAHEARRLVEDGTLLAWVRQDRLVGHVPGVDSLEAVLDRIYSWVVSTYGLFATGAACAAVS